MTVKPKIAFIHYSAPPTVGGVEAVMAAHARVFLKAGYPVRVIAGKGERQALPPGTEWLQIPEMDTQYPENLAISKALELGQIPDNFEKATKLIADKLLPALDGIQTAIIHNVLTKHFNLPLTAALCSLVETGAIRHCIAWCHDFTWTSSHSRDKVHPGFPWDILRQKVPQITYVVISEQRRQELARLFGCSPVELQVVYNGVDPVQLLGLSEDGSRLAAALGLLESDLTLLMPVRVTQAKNIEFAMRVASFLKQEGCRLRLVITGPPDPHDPESMGYFRSLQELRDELQLAAEVRFVYETGPQPDQAYSISSEVVGELYRLADLMFMPSHREGFGMPVLEAGLTGIPVFSTPIPAAVEVGGAEVQIFSASAAPEQVGRKILEWSETSATYQMRKRVRQGFTWEAIFRERIEPLLTAGGSSD